MRGRYYQNIEQPETDNHSLIKRIQETSVVLSDLDGLLVNSENFNQVFVHRTSKAWMRSTISRVVKSDLHLRKFLQVLVSFITSERHPEWARHALVWLRFLLSNYPIPNSTWSNLRRVMAPLRSHANEMAGLHDSYVRAALRGTAVEQWFTQKKVENEETNRERLFYDTINGIPSTGFVFVDVIAGSIGHGGVLIQEVCDPMNRTPAPNGLRLSHTAPLPCGSDGYLLLLTRELEFIVKLGQQTTSESDEETKFLLLGREIHKDPDEELSVASTTTAAATTTATVNHTPVNSPQSKRSPGKANLTDSKSPSPKKRRFSVSRT
ncbi:unnamed protein product [Echinostoma caproni]|uniref:Rap-GAP domain-containing protein n=1 Tax=Echinostoma caproni TaxID=27848 RepID=A0A183AHX3_9TREM|nr:unnamed protein product [Echinostoma caproni]